MSDLVRTLRHELIAVEADIGKLEAEAAKVQSRLRAALDKADKIKAVVAIYMDEDIESPQAQLFEPSPSIPSSPSKSSNVTGKDVSGKSKAVHVREEVTELLQLRGTEHRLKILNYLIEKGVMGHERNPIASLASYLSENKDVFAADGRGNFSLRQVKRQEPPPAPSTGAGSAEAVDSGHGPGTAFNVQH